MLCFRVSAVELSLNADNFIAVLILVLDSAGFLSASLDAALKMASVCLSLSHSLYMRVYVTYIKTFSYQISRN